MRLSDFDYLLPPHCIAQTPAADRAASRMLVLEQHGFGDRHVRDLPAYLRPGDLLVFNDTRVLHARLFGLKASGGKVEILIERLLGEHEALAQIRASHSPRPGSRIEVENAFDVEVLERSGEFYRLRCDRQTSFLARIEAHGRLPLPPYIERAAEAADEARYQTVYARAPGSVAAPTAGLHFDADLLAAVAAAGVASAWVTLHVGAGTFQPVRVENLDEHHMHREHYVVPAATRDAIAAARTRGGRVVAVGTTSLRCLEAAAQNSTDPTLPQAGSGETELFIVPGYQFRVVDALLTNFHLPKSTLLMLVSAFAGTERIRAAYAHAMAAGYRFFSYGDAMLIPARAERAGNR
ncbi:MAG: tRNA preQ1(34) S-adenosylmethionine ribosyltransferase-isomerase QueA [Rhodocyclaceae bacterium]|nr:tRNA preQ1(34) S-adenosylmethionine ribosyltransferase-isomerase QueA [Rhodocyclaceae bacterium]MBX3667092.1 tRNA preQ1(34) S-adenosylmethionine ribosyltransferase-isomerase QueA [Rhodocyclaceae bacterium]